MLGPGAILLLAITASPSTASAARTLWQSEELDISLRAGLNVTLSLVPYIGGDADPYNFDPLYSEGLRLNRAGLELSGRLPYKLDYRFHAGAHGDTLIIREAVIRWSPFDFLRITAGKFNNPTFHNLRLEDEDQALPLRPLLLQMSQPRQVTGVAVSGILLRRVSYWLGFYPTDTKFAELNFGAAVAFHPLGPVARRATGFWPHEQGYQELRFSVGAGVLNTTYGDIEDTYRRWGGDLVVQYRMLSLAAAYYRYRSNTQTTSCGYTTYQTRINHGFSIQASGFVIQERLSATCRYERLYLDAPMTDWAAGLEDVLTCAATLHLRRDLLKVWAGYTARIDDENLNNDHAFVAVQFRL